MTEMTIQDELIGLQRQLSICCEKKERAEQERAELEEGILMLKQKKNEITNSVEQDIAILQEKLSYIKHSNKFKLRNLEQARQIFCEANFIAAMDEFDEGERKAKHRCLDLDDEIRDYNITIDQLRQEISALHQQINLLEVSNE